MQSEQSEFEKNLAKVKDSGKWYAVSMFLTNYGPWGFKIEVDAVRDLPNGQHETSSYNIDGPTLDQVVKANLASTTDQAKGVAYRKTKEMFWAAWKRDHPNDFLTILTFKKAWGL